MIYDIAKFLILWMMVLFMFAITAQIAFAELSHLGNTQDVVSYFFEASLGAWDSNYFQGKNIEG
jgi:hypothetical protein